MDVFSKKERSRLMSRIRGRGNRSTERRMAALLRARGIAGWKLHPGDVEGRPDIYFPGSRTAIFVDGCFWHACKRCFRMPSQNQPFWAEKILRNVKRDRYVNRKLRNQGIRVVRLWEHDLEHLTPRVFDILAALRASPVRAARQYKSHR
jgi:DNA mismatch endonuclease (patch repair protein)